MRAFHSIVWLSFAVCILSTCGPSGNSGSGNPKWRAIADKIIERCDLKVGEKVVLIGARGSFDSLTTILADNISREGARLIATIDVLDSNRESGWYGLSKEELVLRFKEADLGVMLPGAAPNHLPYQAMQDLLRKGKGRTVHFHWSGAYDISGSPLAIDDKISELYRKVILETDYQKLTAIQQSFDQALRSNDLTVTTPAGTNLRFRIGDRPVTKQDGDASLAHTVQAKNLIDREIEIPSGAIRVAPVEETVEGVIAFPDAQWNDQTVTGLKLTFVKGKVTGIKADTGADAVKAELDAAGDSGYSFREIAVGFNPLLAIPLPNPWIPYYGYGAGVVRLSLGDNSELGGKVKGDYVRWNFFTDATIRIGNETWIENGKLLK